jgi:tripartite-type tricarboxylate transporter receptor subunit TctC
MTPTKRHCLKASAALAATSLAPRALAAYPERSLSFICPWPAGGTADATMWALCSAASKVLGLPVVLESKAGASVLMPFAAPWRAMPVSLI